MKQATCCLVALLLVAATVCSAKNITLTIHHHEEDETVDIEVDLKERVLSLKEKISDEFGVPLDEIYLLHGYSELKNRQRLSKYHLTNNTELLLLVLPEPANQVAELPAKIHIRNANRVTTLNVDLNDSVLSVKEKIFLYEGIPVNHQNLIYVSDILEDELSLDDYDIVNNESIFLLDTAPVHSPQVVGLLERWLSTDD